MKTKILNFIRGVILIGVLVAVFLGCTQLLKNKSAQIKYADFFNKETNCDVLFLGTSHTLNTVLPMEMWKESGISSYNWGQSNCTPAVNYYLIQDLIKYTETKLVVMDLYGLMEYEGYGNKKYRNDRLGQQRVQFDELPFSLNKVKAARDIFDNYSKNMDMVINLLTYHNRWKNLNKSDFVVEASPQKGADMLIGVGTGASYTPISKEETTELSGVCYDYFLRFLDFCEEKDIEVLCVYLPYPANADVQRRANSVGEIIESYENATYLNMLDMNLVDYGTDLYLDNAHLNFNGSAKVSRWLAEYIAENYPVDDYSQNEKWIGDWNRYTEYKVGRICDASEPLDKLSLIFGDSFAVEATIRENLVLNENDKKIVDCIESLGENGCVARADAMEYLDKDCDLILTIKNKKTGALVEIAYYAYVNEKLTQITE